MVFRVLQNCLAPTLNTLPAKFTVKSIHYHRVVESILNHQLSYYTHEIAFRKRSFLAEYLNV